jgi:proteasome lid subunit RPN8/RPN11
MATTGEHPVMVHTLTEEQVIEIVHQAEAGYPEEICGIVIGRRGVMALIWRLVSVAMRTCGIVIGRRWVPKTYQVRQVRNIANQERQKDTAGFERDARTAYRMDDREVLRVLREADETGWDVVTFYHSHPDHDAYFSAMDRHRALRADQEPLWPGANYLVVSVRRGRAREARYFGWDDARKDFVGVPATLPLMSARPDGV